MGDFRKLVPKWGQICPRMASAGCKSAVRKVLGLIHPEQYMKSANGSTAQIQGEVRKVIGGIDRLEAMCGISEKMRGYEMFLAQNPSWVGRVVLVQIGLSVPERGNDYEMTRVEVAKLAARGRILRQGEPERERTFSCQTNTLTLRMLLLVDLLQQR